MGATTCFRTFHDIDTISELKKEITMEREYMAFEEGYGYSGTWVEKETGVNIIDKTFSSIEEAEEFIIKNNGKWDKVDAVRFKYRKGTEAQNKRIEKLEKQFYEAQSNLGFIKSGIVEKKRNAKSKTKKCKKCGEVHLVKHLNLECCNCGASFLTKAEDKKIKNATAKVEKLENKLTELKNKKTGEFQEGWVVGGWCSC